MSVSVEDMCDLIERVTALLPKIADAMEHDVRRVIELEDAGRLDEAMEIALPWITAIEKSRSGT